MGTFKKGTQYICSRDIVINKHLWFKGGRIYNSNKDDYIVGCDHCEHSIESLLSNGVSEYFTPIEKVERVEDRVNHPSHYTWLKDKCDIEVIDITRHMNFNLGNTIKYVLRSGHKSEEGMSDKQKKIEDLKKAAFYINDEIKRLENE